MVLGSRRDSKNRKEKSTQFWMQRAAGIERVLSVVVESSPRFNGSSSFGYVYGEELGQALDMKTFPLITPPPLTLIQAVLTLCLHFEMFHHGFPRRESKRSKS